MYFGFGVGRLVGVVGVGVSRGVGGVAEFSAGYAVGVGGFGDGGRGLRGVSLR